MNIERLIEIEGLLNSNPSTWSISTTEAEELVELAKKQLQSEDDLTVAYMAGLERGKDLNK